MAACRVLIKRMIKRLNIDSQFSGAQIWVLSGKEENDLFMAKGIQMPLKSEDGIELAVILPSDTNNKH